MEGSRSTLALIAELAGAQWGLLTTAQAEKRGVTRAQLSRLTAAGALERVDQGIYATPAANDEHLTLRAAWLSLDPSRTAEERLAEPTASGVVSHTSAAGLHHLGDLLDDRPELTVPTRKQTRRNIRIHVGKLDTAEVVLVAGLPTTSIERTVSDLVLDGHDPDHIAQILSQAARRSALDLDTVAERIAPAASRYGQQSGEALVRYLLDLAGLSPESLTHELANTPAGRDLITAGRSAALAEILSASAMSRTDWGALSRQITVGMTPALEAAARALKPIDMRAVIEQLNSPAFRAAIKAAQSAALQGSSGEATAEDAEREDAASTPNDRPRDTP